MLLRENRTFKNLKNHQNAVSIVNSIDFSWKATKLGGKKKKSTDFLNVY
jgi:hypothetical protein